MSADETRMCFMFSLDLITWHINDPLRKVAKNVTAISIWLIIAGQDELRIVDIILGEKALIGACSAWDN